MFDRFTDRARKTMSLSRQAAERLGHDYIGTEHVLIGLIQEGQGVATRILDNLNVDRPKLLQAVENAITPGTEKESAQLPFTPNAKKVLEFAIDEARGLDHNYVGTEHLLLGLLRVENGLAAEVLKAHSLKLENVRSAVMELLGAVGSNETVNKSIPSKLPVPRPAAVANSASAEQWWWSGFTPGSYCVFDSARQEAHRLDEAAISTEHLVVGLCLVSDEIQRMGLDPKVVLGKIAGHSQPSVAPSSPAQLLPFTPGARHVLELALGESFATKAPATPRHLLVGVLLEECLGSLVLKQLGLTAEAVRKKES